MCVCVCVCVRVCVCVCVHACVSCCAADMVEVVHCLFMRGAMYELTKKHGKTHARFEHFAMQFSSTAENLPHQRFQKVAHRLLTVIKRPWNKTLKRTDFEKQFNIARWESFSEDEKKTHTLQKCKGCSVFPQWYTAFPGRSVRMRSLASDVQKMTPTTPLTSQEQRVEAVEALKVAWKNKTGHNLEDDIMATPTTSLQRKPTDYQRKKSNKQVCKKFAEQLKKQYQSTDMAVCLQNRVSLGAWNRMVYNMSFSTPKKSQKSAKPKSHSPTSRTWDTDAVLQAAQQWPADKCINWSAFAREHGISGRNCGQVVKEFLVKQGIDVLKLECRTAPRIRVRRQLLKSYGVSHPAHKRKEHIKADIKNAVNTGRFHLGKECEGKVLFNYVCSNGKVEKRELQVHGRKISLYDVRQSLLHRHEKAGLMREHDKTLEEYLSQEHSRIIAQLQAIGEYYPSTDATLDDAELATRLYTFHHTRMLLLSNDHADLLGQSYLLEVVQVVYDEALFLTDNEYQSNFGHKLNVQAAVEMPHVRLLSMSGSTEEEQLRMAPDSCEDLHCTRKSLQRVVGDPIIDTLRGYTGDLQARWHEAGVQKGGEYRCGVGCGCPTSLLPNYASNLGYKIPSFRELQVRATAGFYGNKPGMNLHQLSLEQLHTELRARGMARVTTMNKVDASKHFCNLLQGVRVPALIAFSPRAELSSFALEQYELWPCEPLHDLKGHISHVLNKIP